MSENVIEILIILFLVILNGVFSMSEIAIVSSRKTRLSQWAKEGKLNAKTALDLSNQPDRFLSTVQIGITLIGILAGVFGGAELKYTISDFLMSHNIDSVWSERIALTTVVVGITYLSLVLGELVPKRIGLNNPEKIAVVVAGPMIILSKLAAPLVSLLAVSTSFIIKVFRIAKKNEEPVTEHEIKELVRQGTIAGSFEKSEEELIQNVFRLDDITVASIMITRSKIKWLDIQDSPENNLQIILTERYSRLLVADGNLDKLLGFVRTKEVLKQYLNDGKLDLSKNLIDPIYVNENVSPLKIFDKVKQSGIHIAVAVDEHGAVQGMITSNDILEAVVGDLPVLGEHQEEWIVKRNDSSWLIDGRLSVVDLKNTFDLPGLPDEEEQIYQTIAGFVMHMLGRVPSPADNFIWNRYRFEVVDMDGRRIDKILLEKHEKAK